MPDERRRGARSAVEGPADLAHLRLEPGFVELIVHDVGEEPGALPLLSHALLETWRRRSHRTLTVAGYRAAGGVRGAIARTAEAVYRGFDEAEQASTRHLFLRLTELGDGTEDTRRRVDLRELAASPDGPAADRVLQRLADSRLVTIDEHTVQVAHEALIREWPRLRTWLDEDREGRRIHRHLAAAAAQDWQALGQEPTELYSGPRLATTTEWLERAGPREELNGARDRLPAAPARHVRRRPTSRARSSCARERSHRRLRNLLAATAVALVLALLAGTVAVVQRGRADHEAATARAASLDATADRLVAQSRTLQAENRYLGTLLALEADRIRDEPQTRGAIFGALLEEPRRVLTIPTPASDAVAPLSDGSALVLTGGRVERWDVRRGLRLAHFPGADVTAVAVASPPHRSRSVGPTGRSPSSTRRADLGVRWSTPPERWVRQVAAGPRCPAGPHPRRTTWPSAPTADCWPPRSGRSATRGR